MACRKGGQYVEALELLAGDLKSEIDMKRSGDRLVKGTQSLGNVISGLMRDTGTLMAERSDRHDLAIGLLEKARPYRPNDPRLLWALGRTRRMVAQTGEKLAEADSILATAAEHLRKHVTGHLAVHGLLPPEIDDMYDKMVLFGDNEWVPPTPETPAPQSVVHRARLVSEPWSLFQ